MILASFHYKEAIELNLARINHFASLNINLNNKTILETGCGGRGDITNYLLSQKAIVTLTSWSPTDLPGGHINKNIYYTMFLLAYYTVIQK
jgi:hypothetical protein